MAQHRLDISELDFENIKGSLKRFLANQNEFKDYDFEGSSLSILLDLLAYNTHYLAYNANFVANEMFLDTAQLRSSVASLAKLVGYTPNGEYDFVVDGKRLYCMKSNDIVIKHERQGNEEEYNPRWARSG